MMKQNVQVFARCRPLYDNETQNIVNLPPSDDRVTIIPKDGSCKEFYFDRVFSPSAHQMDIYDTVVRPMTEQVLMGINCTIFAYGETGTGKTYTMEGVKEDCGVIPRAVSHIFDKLQNRDNEFTVRVSFFELHNEETYDLLSPLDDTTKLKIYDTAHKKGSVVVGNLKEVEVKSTDEIYAILEQGSQKRQTAATLLNACSSRSHTIFTITVHIKESSIEGAQIIKIGKFNLVDLAGSENIGRSGAQDRRAREAGNINQSLLTLGRVITALAENRPHIPYRESKLTRILQDSLGGTTSTSIIATISPADEDISNTVSTLDYASRARSICNRPESNQQLTQTKSLVEYHKEIQILMDKHSSELCELEFRVRNEVALEFKREMEKMRQSYREQYDQDSASLKTIYETKLRTVTESRDKISSELQETIEARDSYRKQVEELTVAKEKLERNFQALFKDQSEQLALEKQMATSPIQTKARKRKVNEMLQPKMIETANGSSKKPSQKQNQRLLFCCSDGFSDERRPKMTETTKVRSREQSQQPRILCSITENRPMTVLHSVETLSDRLKESHSAVASPNKNCTKSPASKAQPIDDEAENQTKECAEPPASQLLVKRKRLHVNRRYGALERLMKEREFFAFSQPGEILKPVVTPIGAKGRRYIPKLIIEMLEKRTLYVRDIYANSFINSDVSFLCEIIETNRDHREPIEMIHWMKSRHVFKFNNNKVLNDYIRRLFFFHTGAYNAIVSALENGKIGGSTEEFRKLLHESIDNECEIVKKIALHKGVEEMRRKKK